MLFRCRPAVSGDPLSDTALPSAHGHLPDRQRVRWHATRAAHGYEAAAWLPRRVAESLMDHLAPVRMEPRRVLDVGAGTGICSRLLARRYPGARVLAVDSSHPMLQVARRRGRRWFAKRGFACGDAERLPLADASVDLVVSSLMLQSCESPDAALAEFYRVLAPGGLLMFTTLGPDSLMELRESWLSVGPEIRVHGFIDMHDLGDALLRAGFQDVVMDTERMTGRYGQVSDLARDLKRLGASNAAKGSPRGLTTPGRLAAMTAAYETLRADGTLPASFEIVFGHAWRQPPRTVAVPTDTLQRARPRP